MLGSPIIYVYLEEDLKKTQKFVEVVDSNTKMPVLSCPLGTQCNMGPDGAVWKTDDVGPELIAIALETHVKFAHQNVAAAPATLAAENLISIKSPGP